MQALRRHASAARLAARVGAGAQAPRWHGDCCSATVLRRAPEIEPSRLVSRTVVLPVQVAALMACVLSAAAHATASAAAQEPARLPETGVAGDDGLYSSPEERPEPAAPPGLPRGFVLSARVGLHFLPVYFPSGELSLFLGGALPVIARRPGHWVALGYRGTVGLGGADIFTTDTRPFFFAHRHHLAVQGVAGRRGRLAYGASCGIVGFTRESYTHNVAYGTPVWAVEGEGLIGYMFGAKPATAQGVFGAQLRLTGAVWPKTTVPIPTIGVVIGVVFGHRLPSPP